jgi:hypothetical protein
VLRDALLELGRAIAAEPAVEALDDGGVDSRVRDGIELFGEARQSRRRLARGEEFARQRARR